MKPILLFTFLCSAIIIHAQNPALIEKKEIELSSDFNKIFPADVAKTGDMNAVLKATLEDFNSHHLYSWNNLIEWNASATEVRVKELELNQAKVALGTINFYNYLPYKATNILKKTFFKNNKVYESVYQAAMPNFQKIFKKMSENETTTYLAYIKQGLDYATSFDLKKEEAELARLEAAGESFKYNRGELQAFIYRRIANKELSQKDCITWITKIYNDLATSVNKNNTKEENFYLVKEVFPNYYTGLVFGKYEKMVFFTKKNDRYERILSADKKIEKYYLPGNSLWIESINDKGQREFSLFRSEQVGQSVTVESGDYTFTNTYGDKGLVWLTYDNNKILLIVTTEKGQLETMELTGEQLSNIVNTNVFLFKNKEGSARLMYYDNDNPRFKNEEVETLSKNNQIKELYYLNGYNSPIWLRCENNKMICLHAPSPNGEIVPIKQEITISTASKTFEMSEMEGSAWLTYPDGSSELLRIETPDKAIQKIPLPSSYKYTSFRKLEQAGKVHFVFGANGSYGLMTDAGKVILEPNFADILQPSDVPFFFIANKNTEGQQSYAMYSLDLKQLTPFLFEIYQGYREEESYSDEHSSVFNISQTEKNVILQQGDKQTLYDFSGKMLIPNTWTTIGRMPATETQKEPIYRVSNRVKVMIQSEGGYLGTKDLYGIISASGKILAEPIYEDIDFRDGVPFYFFGKLTADSTEIEYALYSLDIKPITPFVFSKTETIYYGYESDGEQFVFDFETSSKDKTIILQQGDKQTLYDYSGKMLIPNNWASINRKFLPESSEVFYQVQEVAVMAATDSDATGNPAVYALFDSKGNKLTEFIYTSIGEYKDGFFECLRGEKKVLLDTKGVEK